MGWATSLLNAITSASQDPRPPKQERLRVGPQKQFKQVPVSIDVLLVNASSPSECIKGRTINISKTGMLVEVPYHFPLDTEVYCHLMFQEQVLVQGRIRRQTEKERFSSAVEFYDQYHEKVWEAVCRYQARDNF